MSFTCGASRLINVDELSSECGATCLGAICL